MKQTNSPSADSALISDWQKGDEKAFDKLYYRYYPRLYGLVSKIIKSQASIEEVAEEIVHDVFMKVWKNRDKIDPKQSFQSYIFTITKNEICRYLRKQTSSPITSGSTVKESLTANNQTEQDLHFTDYIQFYHYLLNALPARKRQIFLLNRQEELSYREIAAQLKLSVKTVEFHMNDCLKWLRHNLRLHTDILFLCIVICYLL